jgi:hypothetical protein
MWVKCNFTYLTMYPASLSWFYMLRIAISCNCGLVEVVRIMGKGSKARRAKRREEEHDGQSEERKKKIYLKSTMESEERKKKAYLKHTVEKRRFI